MTIRVIRSFLYFLFLINTTANAQSSSDTIETRSSFWRGTENFVNGKKIPPPEVGRLLKLFPESYDELIKARNAFVIGSSIWVAGAGVALIGILSKDKTSTGPTIIAGAAIATGSIPFIIKSRKHLARSISLYNKSVMHSH